MVHRTEANPKLTEMSLPPFVPNFRDLGVPVSRSRTGAYRIPFVYGISTWNKPHYLMARKESNPYYDFVILCLKR